jgi:hypothetical protein
MQQANALNTSKHTSAGGTADALDFRVFMQQQAALEATRQQHQARSSPDAAARSSAHPAGEAVEVPTAESKSGGKASSLQPGGNTIITIAADATVAAAAAPGAHGEVFSRLYEAGQTSMRRKEAYAKASAAAERAGLLSNMPHPLPLPAGLPDAGRSRPASPAGVTDIALEHAFGWPAHYAVLMLYSMQCWSAF